MPAEQELSMCWLIRVFAHKTRPLPVPGLQADVCTHRATPSAHWLQAQRGRHTCSLIRRMLMIWSERATGTVEAPVMTWRKFGP
jgi:hypothetical protein